MKNLLFCLFIIFSGSEIAGQCPWIWTKTGSGNLGVNTGTSVARDAQGFVYTTGYFSSSTLVFGGNTLNNTNATNSYDMFVVKHDSSGNVIWARSYGGTANDFALGITVDKFGDVIITGYYESDSIMFGTTKLMHNGGAQSPGALGNGQTGTGRSAIFIVKISPSGNVIWAKKAGGNYASGNYDSVPNDRGYGITTDAAGNVFITGYFWSDTAYFDNVILRRPGSSWHSFVAKYNAAGNALWAKAVQSPAHGRAYSVATDLEGSVFFTGYLSGWTRFGSDSIGDWPGGYWIILGKYDANGNEMWARVAGTNADDYGYGVATDACGNAYLTGMIQLQTARFDTITSVGTYTWDAFIAKYNGTNGRALWVRRAQGLSTEEAYSIATDPDGTSYISGLFRTPVTFDTVTLTSAGNTDIFIAKYDADGKMLAAQSAGGASDESGVGIASAGKGTVYVTGRLASNPAAFGCYNVTSSGVYTAKAVLGNTGSGSGILSVDKTQVCTGETVNFNDQTNGATNWNWTISGGTPNSSTNSSVSVTYATPGTYEVRLVVNTPTDTVIKIRCIVVTPGPVMGNITANPDTVCSGQATALNYFGTGASLQWQSATASGSFANINGATSPSYQTTMLSQNMRYRVVVNQGACSDTSADFTVRVVPIPTPAVSPDDTIICASDSTLVSVSGSYTSYLWNNGDTRPYTYLRNAGGYWLTVTDAAGCTAESNRGQLSVHPTPPVSIVVQGDTLSSFGAVTYRWFYNGNLIPNATDPVYIAMQSGNYSLEVTDANGCTARSTEVSVVINSLPTLTSSGHFVFPNPFVESFTIRMMSGFIQRVSVYDVMGKEIIHKNLKTHFTSYHQVNLAGYSSGIYLLKVTSEGGEFSTKMIKLQ